MLNRNIKVMLAISGAALISACVEDTYYSNTHQYQNVSHSRVYAAPPSGNGYSSSQSYHSAPPPPSVSSQSYSSTYSNSASPSPASSYGSSGSSTY